MFKKFIFAAITLCLIACSDSPSEQQVLEQIKQSVNVSEVLEVANIDKLNGWMDKQHYVAQVSYEIIFIRDPKDAAHQLSKANKDNPFAGIFGEMALKMEYGNFKAGDTQQFTKDFRFRKTEQGWRLIEAQQ
ncbi:hypothetical protein [Paraferrimonas sp. SM1919]|uniref:hypothetical protein n=1 Tax=Paraferrimonas sp. SM1919 TaxID=2662263 RepID=UPI0013D47C80|nr:hypothetical protein [Paraferrimonas sp. SM1919]